MWSDKNFQARMRGFSTPQPPTLKSRRWSPGSPMRTRSLSEKKKKEEENLFHVIHKVPAGDSPYVRAKHVQIIEKDPSRAISLFWAAINSGDRVDSALKDMAVVMKQLNRSDEAIEAIKSFRHLCPLESQESLDNVLVELYKRSGRIEEQIEMLEHKVKTIEEGIAFGGKKTKSARSQGKKVEITVEQEYSRLLGNLAWAYLQQDDFKSAEELYRKALSLEPDKNKKCNLAICLMHMNRMAEAKFLLQTIRASPIDGCLDDDSYVRSFERATQILTELESKSGERPIAGEEERHKEIHPPFASVRARNWEELPTLKNGGHNYVSGSRTSVVGYEIGSSYKKAYASPVPARGISKVPFTQPKRCSNYGDQRRGTLWEAGRSDGFNRKLTFGQPIMTHENFERQISDSTNEMSKETLRKPESVLPCVVSEDWGKRWWKDLAEVNNDESVSGELERNSGANVGKKNLDMKEREMPTVEALAAAKCERLGEAFCNGVWDQSTNNICAASSVRLTEIVDNNSFVKKNSGKPDYSHETIADNAKPCLELQNQSRHPVSGNHDKRYKDISSCKSKKMNKSWADMVEEDEEELFLSGTNRCPESKLVYHPSQQSSFSSQIPSKGSEGRNSGEEFNDENVNSNILKDGYYTQPKNSTSAVSLIVRRSLCFDQQPQPGRTDNYYCSSPLQKKVLSFEAHNSLLANEKEYSPGNGTRRNRLQVFRDITLSSERPPALN